MASTKTFVDMRANPVDTGDFIVTVMKGQRLEILERRDGFVRVRLLMPTAPEGWLPASAIDDIDPPDAPIKADEFIRECAFQEQVFGVPGHYFAAIAKLRSDIKNNTTPQGEFGEIGLFRLTAAEWAADWGSEADFGFKFSPAEIGDWRNQCTLFALMARRALIACESALGRRPNSVDLLLSQIIGAKATAGLRAAPAKSVQAVLDEVADDDLPKGGLTRDRLIKRYASLLGSPAETGTKVLATVEVSLRKALTETAALIPADLIKPIADATQPNPSGSSTLGSLSKKYESGIRGPGTVSSGAGDAGGVSYGTYQFSSTRGSAQVFVASLPPDLKARFAGKTPGQPDFSAVWVAIATEDPQRFDKLQHDHIKAEFYDVLVAKVMGQLGFDVNTRSAALQNCCWSTAVQHGPSGGASIVNGVIGPLKAAGAPPIEDIKAFDEVALRRIYAERGRDNGLAHFSSSSADVRAGVVNRFRNELADALKMLG